MFHGKVHQLDAAQIGPFHTLFHFYTRFVQARPSENTQGAQHNMYFARALYHRKPIKKRRSHTITNIFLFYDHKYPEKQWLGYL